MNNKIYELVPALSGSFTVVVSSDYGLTWKNVTEKPSLKKAKEVLDKLLRDDIYIE